MYELKGVSKRGNYCVAENSDKTFVSKSDLHLLLLGGVKVQGAILDDENYLLIKKSIKETVLEEPSTTESEPEEVEEKTSNPDSILNHMDEVSLALDNGIYCSKRDVEELKEMLTELNGVDSEEAKDLISKIEDTLTDLDDGSSIEAIKENPNNFKPIPYDLFANAKQDANGDWVWSDEEEDTDDSTLTKLQSLLTEEQNKLIRDYIFYLSRRAFELNKGTVSINEITKKKIEKLKDIKKGGTWVYAGMVDYGYMGSSICPHCGSRMSSTAVSKCCNDIVFTTSHKVRILKDLTDENGDLVFFKGSIKPKSFIKKKIKRDLVAGEDFEVLYNRTYNGKCNSCGSTCVCITRDAITSTKKNRDRQHGIICSKCGNELVQQTHYTTFGDQVRYVHILWNIEDSDLETDFYGQLVNNSLEKVLESKKCIKFGLDNAAKLLGIAKGSLAYQALQLAQKASIEDIAEMYAQLSSTSYKLNNTDIDYYTTTTPLQLKTQVGQNRTVGLQATLDFVNKLKLGNVKNKLLGSSKQAEENGTDFTEVVEPKALTLFDEFVKQDLIPPRTLVLLIRDQFCGWKSHYFGNRTKNQDTKALGYREFRWLGKDSKYSEYMLNSITTYFGNLKDLTDLLSSDLTTRPGNYLNYTQEKNGYTQKDLNYLYLYKNDRSLYGMIRKYTEIYLQFLVCGIYAYTGTAPNTTELYKNLSAYTESYTNALAQIRSMFFTDVDYKPEYLEKLNGLLAHIRERKENLKPYKIPIKQEDESGFYKDAKDCEYELLSDYYNKMNRISPYDLMGKLLSEYGETIKEPKFVDAFAVVYKMFYTRTKLFRSTIGKTIDEYTHELDVFIDLIDNNADGFNQFCIDRWQKEIDALNDDIRIRMAEDNEREKKIQLENEEKERKAKEVENINTVQKMLDYLANKDFSEMPEYLSDGKPLTFHVSILDTVLHAKREPSSAQLYRIKTLFKDYTGVEKDFKANETNTEKTSFDIDEIPNFAEMIDYFSEHEELFKTLAPITKKIFDSVVKYKKVSKKQAVYIKVLPKIYQDNTGIEVNLKEILGE